MKTRSQTKGIINEINANNLKRYKRRLSSMETLNQELLDIPDFNTSRTSSSNAASTANTSTITSTITSTSVNTTNSLSGRDKDDDFDFGVSYLASSDDEINSNNKTSNNNINSNTLDDISVEKDQNVSSQTEKQKDDNLGDSGIDDDQDISTTQFNGEEVEKETEQTNSQDIEMDENQRNGINNSGNEENNNGYSDSDNDNNYKPFEDDRAFESEDDGSQVSARNLNDDQPPNTAEFDKIKGNINSINEIVKREVIKQVASILSYNSLENIIKAEVERYISKPSFYQMIQAIVQEQLELQSQPQSQLQLQSKLQSQSNSTSTPAISLRSTRNKKNVNNSNNVNNNNNNNNPSSQHFSPITTRNKRRFEEENSDNDINNSNSNSNNNNNNDNNNNSNRPVKRGRRKATKSAITTTTTTTTTSNNKKNNSIIKSQIVKKKGNELILKDYVSVEDYNQMAQEKVSIGKSYSFLRYDKKTSRKHINKFLEKKNEDPDYEMPIYVRHHDESDEYHLNWFDAFLVSIDEDNKKCTVWFEEEPDRGTFEVEFNRVMIDEYDTVYNLFTFNGFESQIKKEQSKSSYVYLAEYRIKRDSKEYRYLQDVLIVKLLSVDNVLVYVLKERKLISLPMQSIYIRKTL